MSQFVSLGMYAFTPQLRQAWQAFYSAFLQHWSGSTKLEQQCRSDHQPEALDDQSLFFGHTCGYPLTHQLKGKVLPFCVPVFHVPGCQGIQYSSQFIVSTASDISTLADCKGLRAAVNNPDSNSGMNVLRAAIAPLAQGKTFFDSVIYTGSHLSSMQSVAAGDTDLAAIDAVSYQLALDAFPGLAQQLRSIGFSEASASLPLVYQSTMENFDKERCLSALNRALDDCRPMVADVLHLQNFKPVTLENYDGIIAIEQSAIALDYPGLV